MNPGRVPLRASPYKVNCEIASSAPRTSTSDLFILPVSSSKMRKLTIFSASQAASASVSFTPTPISAHKPSFTAPVTRRSFIAPVSLARTLTLASLTLWTTALTRKRLLLRVEVLQQGLHVLGVLLFLLQDVLEHAPRGGVVIAEPADHLQVRLDGDALGDEVLLDHVDQRVALHVLRVAAGEQACRVEVGRAVELGDALRDHVGVLLLFAGVLRELVGHRLRVDARGHVVMALVAQHADDLGRQRVVQQLDGGVDVAAVGLGDGTLLDVFARPALDLFDVGEERRGLWICHLVLLAFGRRRPASVELQEPKCLGRAPIYQARLPPYVRYGRD